MRPYESSNGERALLLLRSAIAELELCKSGLVRQRELAETTQEMETLDDHVANSDKQIAELSGRVAVLAEMLPKWIILDSKSEDATNIINSQNVPNGEASTPRHKPTTFQTSPVVGSCPGTSPQCILPLPTTPSTQVVAYSPRQKSLGLGPPRFGGKSICTHSASDLSPGIADSDSLLVTNASSANVPVHSLLSTTPRRKSASSSSITIAQHSVHATRRNACSSLSVPIASLPSPRSNPSAKIKASSLTIPVHSAPSTTPCRTSASACSVSAPSRSPPTTNITRHSMHGLTGRIPIASPRSPQSTQLSREASQSSTIILSGPSRSAKNIHRSQSADLVNRRAGPRRSSSAPPWDCPVPALMATGAHAIKQTNKEKTSEVNNVQELIAAMNEDGSGTLSMDEFVDSFKKLEMARKGTFLDFDAKELNEKMKQTQVGARVEVMFQDSWYVGTVVESHVIAFKEDNAEICMYSVQRDLDKDGILTYSRVVRPLRERSVSADCTTTSLVRGASEKSIVFSTASTCLSPSVYSWESYSVTPSPLSAVLKNSSGARDCLNSTQGSPNSARESDAPRDSSTARRSGARDKQVGSDVLSLQQRVSHCVWTRKSATPVAVNPEALLEDMLVRVSPDAGSPIEIIPTSNETEGSSPTKSTRSTPTKSRGKSRGAVRPDASTSNSPSKRTVSTSRGNSARNCSQGRANTTMKPIFPLARRGESWRV